MALVYNEDVRRQYVEKLGPELGRVYHGLYEEVAWLHDKWREFTELFGTSPGRIDVLQEAAGRFFGYVQSALWEDILLHLSRLTDRPSIAGKPTLTVLQLPGLIGEQPLKDDVQRLVDIAKARCDFARDWRNQFIAHRSLPFMLDEGFRGLAFASRKSVVDAIDSLDEVVVAVHEFYFDSGLDLRVPGGPGDALDLLRVLQDGIESAREREERLLNGTPLPEDLRSRPAI